MPAVGAASATSDSSAAAVNPSVLGAPSTPVQTPVPEPVEHSGYRYGLHSHIVGEDETLAAIAQRYGLSVEQLREWNHLDPNESVKTGQQLKLEP